MHVETLTQLRGFRDQLSALGPKLVDEANNARRAIGIAESEDIPVDGTGVRLRSFLADASGTLDEMLPALKTNELHESLHFASLAKEELGDAVTAVVLLGTTPSSQAARLTSAETSLHKAAHLVALTDSHLGELPEPPKPSRLAPIKDGLGKAWDNRNRIVGTTAGLAVAGAGITWIASSGWEQQEKEDAWNTSHVLAFDSPSDLEGKAVVRYVDEREDSDQGVELLGTTIVPESYRSQGEAVQAAREFARADETDDAYLAFLMGESGNDWRVIPLAGGFTDDAYNMNIVSPASKYNENLDTPTTVIAGNGKVL